MSPSVDNSDGKLLAEAYLRWGEEFPAHVRGEFAIAVWDPARCRVLLARDHVGCAPLFFSQHRSTIAFASDLNGVLASLSASPDLDEEWIADLLTANTIERTRTAYRGVQRVPAQHIVVASQEHIRSRAYWDLVRADDPFPASTGEYEDELRDRLTDAVRALMRHDGRPIGCELSGGLDSSGVAALAAAEARSRGVELIAFTHTLANRHLDSVWPFEDERALAVRLQCHAGIARHVPVTADGYGVTKSLRTAIALQGAPSMSSYDLFSDALRNEVALHSTSELFSGFGGDEMVSGSASLVPEGWIKGGEVRRLRRGPPGATGPSAPGWRLRFLRSFVRHWLGTTGRGSRAREILTQGEHFANSLVGRLPVCPTFAERWDLHERALAPWRARADAAAASDFAAYERHLALHPATALRLEACNIAAADRGIVYRYPLLDVPLLEWFHSVPADQRWGRGWGRYLFRRSLSGIVPFELLWRDGSRQQSNTIPNAVARVRQDRASIGALVARAPSHPELGFLDAARLELWADSFFAFASAPRGSAPPQALAPGRFSRVLAVLVYYEMRREGWRPGASVASTTAIDAGPAGRLDPDAQLDV